MWEPQGQYSKYILKQPTILHSANAIRGLFNYPCTRVAVVYGTGVCSEQKEQIQNSTKGYEINFFAKSWSGEPTTEGLSKLISQLETFRPDVIIAIGGGSVIDGVKVARLYYEFPFFEYNVTRFNLLEWKTKFIAIPTTVGSGAEISSAAVLINKNSGNKEMVVCHQFIPDVIVLDPSFIKSSNNHIILSSVVDAMAHIIEGYVSIIGNTVCDVYAEKGLYDIVSVLKKGIDAVNNEELLRLQTAGYLGGIVQNHCIVGAAHAIAHQLSAYGYGHSEAVARVLPYVIESNFERDDAASERYESLSRSAGLGSTSDLITFIRQINDQVGYSSNEKLIELLGSLSEDPTFINNVISDKGGKGNPITLNEEYIRFIISKIVSDGK